MVGASVHTRPDDKLRVKALVEAGADLKPPCLGQTALQWAVAKGHGEVAALLREAGARA